MNRLDVIYFGVINKDRYAQNICKRALILSRNWQNITYFRHVDIKLKKVCSVFDFDTVVISEQSFFIIFLSV